MVNLLIPRVLQGQSAARAAHGIIAHGTVIATRVEGGVPSGREAVLNATWGDVVLTEPVDFDRNPLQEPQAFGVPIAFENRLGYTLRSVSVVDGGDYVTAPALQVIRAGQTYVGATLVATVTDGTITRVAVTDGGIYSRPGGRVIAEIPRRTHYADVDVLGIGGRRHTLRDCAAVIPVRVGDPVVVEAPNGDPRQGCFVSGRQVPARPLIYQAPPDLPPERDTDTRWRIGSRAPYRYLGWPQAYAFDVSATVVLGWANDSFWRPSYPALATLDLQVVLQTMVAGAWEDTVELERVAANADLEDAATGGTARWHWSGIYQLDDGSGAIKALLLGGALSAIAVYVDAGTHSVKWNGSSGYGWTLTQPDLLTIDDTDYAIQIVEMGSGTY